MDDVGQRFGIRFSKANAVLMGALGMGRARSYAVVDGRELRVRMGWAFRADIPRSAIVEVGPKAYVWWAFGVHGGLGRWIVNGSGHDMVSVRLDALVRARVLGIPVRLRELWVSIDDPDGFQSALSP